MANNSRYHLIVLLTLVVLGVFTLAALSSLSGKGETPHRSAPPEPAPAAIAPVTGTASPIEWVKDIDKGIKLSAKLKKPMMIDFYTDWCTYCKVLDRDVYTRPEVADMARKFVCIKLNPEKDERAMALAQQVKVQGFPYILFVSSTKKAVRAIPGAPAPGIFLDEMKTAYKLALAPN